MTAKKKIGYRDESRALARKTAQVAEVIPSTGEIREHYGVRVGTAQVYRDSMEGTLDFLATEVEKATRELAEFSTAAEATINQLQVADESNLEHLNSLLANFEDVDLPQAQPVAQAPAVSGAGSDEPKRTF